MEMLNEIETNFKSSSSRTKAFPCNAVSCVSPLVPLLIKFPCSMAFSKYIVQSTDIQSARLKTRKALLYRRWWCLPRFYIKAGIAFWSEYGMDRFCVISGIHNKLNTIEMKQLCTGFPSLSPSLSPVGLFHRHDMSLCCWRCLNCVSVLLLGVLGQN